MTMEEAWTVLRSQGFCGYMGPGYSTDHAINDFMSRYPRGKGIKGFQQDLMVLYQACLVYKQRRSRTLAYYRNGGTIYSG